MGDFFSFFLNTKTLSHELGHLCGSRHTFACVWIDNDGVPNQSLGGCSLENQDKCIPCSTLPESKGCDQPGGDTISGKTIMSYCSAQFISKTFGPQPGAIIRQGVINYNKNKNICSEPTSNSFLKLHFLKQMNQRELKKINPKNFKKFF